ncbi:MAG: acetyl-CoA carboxylase biotin carboxylase subunit [Gemmatimonadota bacterium]|nr:MAG: acetyl-CoA carboxylase biotin carboxylase subunit [Gemmatimonadota bacterium]
MLKKVLVANRGEIAVRVIRACREIGVESVAVFSEADRLAPHVWLADEAYPIGPARAAESYLSIVRLLNAAQRSGADAIHPGYGFLAENADFAAAVEGAGLTFVGPSAETIALMGDKTEARRAMEAAGVSVVPGTKETLADLDAVRDACHQVGYPVLLKAAAGGGGKGMRKVEVETDLESAFGAAQREAQAAFSDSRIYVEKFLENPRHIEFQILADTQGNVIHLNERECSIQRRHQKLIEESPSPVMTPELREQMGRQAVAAARGAKYRGAGTVEFMVAGGKFYFLEMNTRLQVEHPVTEMITGVDLVHQQLRIAAGEPIDIESVEPQGHAIECRINAEDPFNDFLPAGGRVDQLRLPGGTGVRWDGGIVQGTEIGLHYDPLVAKLIVHAQDRQAAIARMARALDELLVDGVATIAPFHRRVMDEPDFRAGNFHTGYLDLHPDLLSWEGEEEKLRAVALVAALLENGERRRVRMDDGLESVGERSGWRWPPAGWRGRGWGLRG